MNNFLIYSIDLPGMGYSSKENIKITNYEDTLAFFMQTIKLWAEKLNLTRFTLAGHSFGGYIASQFTIHYPELI